MPVEMYACTCRQCTCMTRRENRSQPTAPEGLPNERFCGAHADLSGTQRMLHCQVIALSVKVCSTSSASCVHGASIDLCFQATGVY
jgi:hypothetical protein